MKSLIFLSLLCFASASFGSGFQEEIQSFTVDVDLKENGHVFVTETISYNFGNYRKRGIFRDIPLNYKRKLKGEWGGVSAYYKVRFKLLEVTNASGKPYKYKVIRNSKGVRIRVGNPRVYLSGLNTYVIKYRVQRVINQFEEQDEFYWNVTGNYWDVPINKAQVNVNWPKNLDLISSVNFYGNLGSTKASTEGLEKESGFYSVKASNLYPRQGLTIGLGFKKGGFKKPLSITKAIWFLMDNLQYFIFIIIPALVAFIYSLVHKKHGKDPLKSHVIQVQYEPPPRLNPAEAGTLQDEVVDTSDIVATVLDLAARGHIKIKEVSQTGFLFLSFSDYEFIKTDEFSKKNLSPFERTFVENLFSGSNKVVLSDLKNKFYVHLSPLKKKIYADLVSKGLFDKSPAAVRGSYTAVSLVLIIAAHLFLGLVVVPLLNLGNMVLPLMASGFFCVLISIYFSKKMPRKTKKGAKLYQQLLGFKEFLSRVEKPRIERMHHEDPAIFGRMLPYAVVLGCADEWAEKFENLLTEPLSWYEGRDNGIGNFSPRVFVNSMGSSMNSMANTFSSSPQSSSAGSGGSFSSGGGGFSGGGFGGGGGGSW